jgi:hypothetical protein
VLYGGRDGGMPGRQRGGRGMRALCGLDAMYKRWIIRNSVCAVLVSCAVRCAVGYRLEAVAGRLTALFEAHLSARTSIVREVANDVFFVSLAVFYAAAVLLSFWVITGITRNRAHETYCRRCHRPLRGLSKPECPLCGELI